MEDDKSEFKLSMGIPNGIILSLIGVLVLATPLTTPVAGAKLIMDLIAGLVLVVGGLISLLLGLKQRTHVPAETDRLSHSDERTN